jgi:hypothetical protein
MAAHTKPRKLVPLAAVLSVLAVAAVGGYALAGNHAPELADSHAPETVNLARTAGATGQQMTVTACLTSGKLTRISVGTAPKCPAKSTPLHWTAQSGPASWPSPEHRPSSSSSPSPGSPPSTSSGPSTTGPDPVPATTSPSTVQTTTSTSPASWAWCSSAPLGQWTTPDGRFDLYNNEWNTSGNPGPQTICGNSESDWQAVSNQRAGNTAVLTAPSVQIPYNHSNGYPLSNFSSLSSSYAEDMHAVAGTDAEAMYDIWLNSLGKEVMFWVDNHGQTPAGSVVATTTFSGATWNLWQTRSGYWAFVREGNASSGTVDLLAGLHYLESRGDLTGTDLLWQVNFGWEICSTAGAPETFTVSNYSVGSSPSS